MPTTGFVRSGLSSNDANGLLRTVKDRSSTALQDRIDGLVLLLHNVVAVVILLLLLLVLLLLLLLLLQVMVMVELVLLMVLLLLVDDRHKIGTVVFLVMVMVMVLYDHRIAAGQDVVLVVHDGYISNLYRYR